jgi:hypothetical protein
MSQKTNTEFVTHLMEFSDHGALMQLAVIDALDKWSDRVIKHEEELMKQLEGSMIHGPAWIETAREMRKKLDQHRNKGG